MKNVRRKKKKFTKASLKKACMGSISILLCLLLTPFLSLALGLVEYARYQEVIEITDEIYELTGISVLSDYDNYIHNRFGLLATSQDGEFADGADELLNDNIKVLGKQVSLEVPSFTGKLSLSNTETLRQQVVDFSELTSTTAVLAEDFNLEDLLNKLQNVQQFQDIMNTVDSLADLADALTVAVEKLEALESALTSLESSVNTAVSSANTLSTQMADLYKKLGENGITLPQEASLEEIEAAVTSFTDGYLQDFKDIYSTAKTLVDNLNSIKTNLTSIKTAASEFISAVQAARTAVENISATNSADSSGQISAAATTTLEEVLKDMEGLIEDTLSDITDETVNIAKDTVNEIIDNALESTGLKDVVGRYSSIVNGDYFALPLSETAKQDIVDLLKTVKTVYSSNSPDALTDYFKDKFVPRINIDASNIKEDVVSSLENATNKLVDGVGDKLISLLTKLVNIVKNLFDLDLFYEADLNAYVNIGNASSSPYQSFMDAIGSLFTAVDDFKAAMEDGGLFEKIKGALEAMGDMFAAIGDLMGAIIDIAGAAVDSIVELGSSLITGDVRGLYEKMLISGYMRHNLPCRLDSGDYAYDADGNQLNLNLTGKGLTGFDFNNIARPAVFTGQSATLNSDSGSKFQGLASTLQNLKNGYGTDTMFKGAELEYIRAGTNSEIANQVICFFDLYFLRLLLDLPSVFMDGEVNAVAGAATVASWVVYILYIVAEPFCDTLLLVNGETVPLIRSDCWLTATGLVGFIDKLGSAVLGEALQNELNSFTSSYATSSDGSSGSDDGGLDYRTHMLVMLLIYVDSDTQIQRLSNLIELETAEYYRQKGKTFDMNKTYTAVQISAEVTFNPFFDLGVFNGGGSFLPSYDIKQTVSY